MLRIVLKKSRLNETVSMQPGRMASLISAKYKPAAELNSAKNTISPATSKRPKILFGTQRLTPCEAAFASRIGLENVSASELYRVLNHPSSCPANQENYRKLVQEGKSLAEATVKKHLKEKFPYLPKPLVRNGLDFLLNAHVLSNVGRIFSLESVLRCRPKITRETSFMDSSVLSIMGHTVYALVGLIKRVKGEQSAHAFVQICICDRAYTGREFADIKNPKTTLTRLMDSMKKDPPVSRMLHETGRKSGTSVYVVGVYSGLEKLGEGFARSIKEAERRAALDTLCSFYFAKAPQ